MKKKIAIIGGGIAGLSAGCYAQMNGFDAEIFESHTMPGGLCTAWNRGDYRIDGCLDWLLGSGPENDFYKLWKELDAFDDEKIINHESFGCFEDKDKRKFILYGNPDRLVEHMLALSPEDETQIRQLGKWVKKFADFSLPLDKAPELFTLFDIIKMMIKIGPLAMDFKRLNGISIIDYANTYKDPLIRDSFKEMFGMSDISLFSLVMVLGAISVKSAGYIQGGSLELVKGIENKFLKLGGKIRFRSRVESILVHNNQAVGLKLEDGSTFKADIVLSTADMHNTLYKMLDGNFLDPAHEALFREEKLTPSCVQVSLGVNTVLPKEENCIAHHFPASASFELGGETFDKLSVRRYDNDPDLAPEGKFLMAVRYHMDKYEAWKELYAHKKAYKQKKEEILQFTINQLEKRYPGITAQIEVSDVCTPMTYQRYANTWKGTYMTWMTTPGNYKKLQEIKKTVPGLKNFWMSGMWLMPPGGLPGALKSSRDVIQIICKNEKQGFVTK